MPTQKELDDAIAWIRSLDNLAWPYAKLVIPAYDFKVKEIENAYAMLSLYGVPRNRANTAANGIDVLATRYQREINCLNAEILDLKRELQLSRDSAGNIEDHTPGHPF